ncbi:MULTISPECIES: hypothetical protein [unclassified Curtobacterium]|uniref:hypothetical protein n=1 Tax=unclassified Curtobacterium TaxID=257496 RepID=UPI0008DE3524|nr:MULTISPECIES: hypothetical protein [unclassified Curtobacterium]OIH99744.1 hypothetical protein BIU92_02400 [Curtobacterium sp. MCBA15_003]OII30420.1 hypothetical protein BIU94_06490 [Curtobacterium sp. MMLR14_006]
MSVEALSWDDTVALTLEVLGSATDGGLSDREVAAGAGSMTPTDAHLVETWLNRVIQSRVLPALVGWRRFDRAAAGRRAGGPLPDISDAVILTIALVLVMEESTVRVRDMERALAHRLTPEAREVLGIAHLYDNPFKDWYFLAHRAIHRIIATFDPYVANAGFQRNNWKAMTLEQRNLWEANLDEAFLDRMRLRGEWFMNALLEMSIRQQAPQFRRVKTAFTIDQSAVTAGVHQARWKRDKHGNEVPMRNKLDTTTNQAEPRRVLALEADWAPKKKGAKKRNADEERRVSRIKWELSYMANIIIDVIEDPDLDKKLQAPQLIRAISLGTPNKRIGDHAIALLDSLEARGYELSRLSFDRGYSQLTDAFHEEFVRRRIPVVKDYVERQKGITNGALGGAIMVEGRYVCPSTPADLLEATGRWERGELTDVEYGKELDQMEDYELSVHEKKGDGTLRLSRPASGISPTASCPLRKLHPRAVPDEEADRVRIQRANITDRQKDYKVCCQTSVTVKPDQHVQQRQLLRHNSRQWFKTYRSDRSSSESTNDLLQRDHKLHVTTNRPLRGLAAQKLALALLAVKSNMTRIINFENALREEQLRAAAGRAPKRRKQDGEYLQRSRDRRGETRYLRNPPPRELVPYEEPALPDPPV